MFAQSIDTSIGDNGILKVDKKYFYRVHEGTIYYFKHDILENNNEIKFKEYTFHRFDANGNKDLQFGNNGELKFKSFEERYKKRMSFRFLDSHLIIENPVNEDLSEVMVYDLDGKFIFKTELDFYFPNLLAMKGNSSILYAKDQNIYELSSDGQSSLFGSGPTVEGNISNEFGHFKTKEAYYTFHSLSSQKAKMIFRNEYNLNGKFKSSKNIYTHIKNGDRAGWIQGRIPVITIPDENYKKIKPLYTGKKKLFKKKKPISIPKDESTSVLYLNSSNKNIHYFLKTIDLGQEEKERMICAYKSNGKPYKKFGTKGTYKIQNGANIFYPAGLNKIMMVKQDHSLSYYELSILNAAME